MSKTLKIRFTITLLGSLLLTAIFLYYSKDNSNKLDVDTIYFFGDSITFGMGSSEGNDFASKTSDYFDVNKINVAVSAQRLTNYNYPNNFRDSVSKVVPIKGNMKGILIIAFGTNDARLQNPFSDNPTNNPDIYYSQFQECLNVIASKGWLKSEIILISPFYDTDKDLSTYNTNRQIYESYVNKLKQLASDNKITFFDAYRYMQRSGGDKLISSDNIHPNDSGYDVLSEGLIAILDKKINRNGIFN
jgi:lysophospholipase L1-like esterase